MPVGTSRPPFSKLWRSETPGFFTARILSTRPAHRDAWMATHGGERAQRHEYVWYYRNSGLEYDGAHTKQSLQFLNFATSYLHIVSKRTNTMMNSC